ncbi:CHASE2 domain-containing protein [Desulfococcaceae bacterium HSG8]|nr:CHASE2 domain-containing protein [Desulfococcaceae bacterium HSG8]
MRNNPVLKKSIFIIMLIAILCSAFLFKDVFNIFDSAIESYTLRLGDWRRTKKLRKEIALIAIEDENFDSSWREKHAKLVRKLSEAGARVIVFDMFFEKEKEEYDEKFINAIKQAKKRGTAVVTGIRRFDEDDNPEILEVYRNAVSGYGILCISLTPGDRIQAPMAVLKGNNSLGFYSLSLIASASYEGGEILHVDTELVIIKTGDGRTKKYKFPYLRKIEQVHPKCEAVFPGDNIVEIMINQVSLAELRDPNRRVVYKEVINSLQSAELVKYFNSKIVLIGIQNGIDFHAERWHGMELHACAINTILNNIYIRPTPKWFDIFLIFCVGILGIIYARIRKSSEFRFGKLIMGVLVSILCFFLFQVLLYRFLNILTNVAVYAVTAFFLSYFAGGTIENDEEIKVDG